MGSASRRKGKKGEHNAKLALLEHDFQVFPRPRGEAGDDFTVLRDGHQYSVEVKTTCSLSYQHFDQCKRQAAGGERMLMWHPSKWFFPATFWLVFVWPKGDKPYVLSWEARA